MSVIEDIQHRSAHIRWPDGIVPEQADLFAHNDIVIAAPPAEIWRHIVHATAWPDWYVNARNVTVNAPSRLLGAGVTFDWISLSVIFGDVPLADVLILLIGLPLVAAVGGWLLAGRDPKVIARQPLN